MYCGVTPTLLVALLFSIQGRVTDSVPQNLSSPTLIGYIVQVHHARTANVGVDRPNHSALTKSHLYSF